MSMELGMEIDNGDRKNTLKAFAVIQVSDNDGVDKNTDSKNGDNGTNSNILQVGQIWGRLDVVAGVKD